MPRKLTPGEEAFLAVLGRKGGEALFVQLADDLDCSGGEVVRLAKSLHAKGRVHVDTVARHVRLIGE